ncbi:hypothetical protein DFH09DRAFT_1371740 [Mycena vulgaris]|nr:hypothetical protein DFH09DRAFT_1371740 [Mycena vulgaris]
MSHISTSHREAPPHLSAPPVASNDNPPGPDMTTGGTSAFLSAKMTVSSENPAPVAPSSISSGEHTTSNDQPSGMRVKVQMDSRGCHYVVHPSTGMRFDVSDDETIPLETPYYATPEPYQPPHIRARVEAGTGTGAQMNTLLSPSSISDMNLSVPGNSVPIVPAEQALDALMGEIGVSLTSEQQVKYSSIRGMLSTGRASLLSTTVFVAEQRAAIGINVRSIALIRHDMEAKLLELHQRVVGQDERIEQCLEENLRALRAFGSTEAQLEQLTLSLAQYNARNSPRPELAPLSQPASRATTPLEDMRPELEGALPPRGPGESEEAFHRRALNTVRRKGRTAASFMTEPLEHGPITAPTPSTAHFAIKSTRFEDMGSISTAAHRPFKRYGSEAPSGPAPRSTYSATRSMALTEGSQYDSFHKDKEIIIRKIVAREVGETLLLPPNIKPPKVDPPAKYPGVNDLDVFMRFIEMLCTWLRSQMLCGYGTAVDDFRMTMLKMYLSGPALDWFIQSVNSAHYTESAKMSFADALCALHRRFVTTANAQRTTVAFDTVKYDDSVGPEGFAEALIKHTNQMAHVPDEFRLSQRFLAGIPQTVRFKMVVDHQMSAEFTPLETLRTAARQLWEALSKEGATQAVRPGCASRGSSVNEGVWRAHGLAFCGKDPRCGRNVTRFTRSKIFLNLVGYSLAL